MKKIILSAFILCFSTVSSADIMKDFDSLGGNDVLINRAKGLQPEKEVRIVQNRTVKRQFRHEFSPTYTNFIGGDANLETQSFGLDYHFHINHHWSLGLSYYSAYNKLSKEGNFLIENNDLIPDVDHPEGGYEMMVNYAPFYGKINFFDMGVVQFDVYGIGTYGTIQLKSGDTSNYSLGLGVGLWISQHITSRFELRQRFYQAQRYSGGVDIQSTLASFSLGYML